MKFRKLMLIGGFLVAITASITVKASNRAWDLVLFNNPINGTCAEIQMPDENCSLLWTGSVCKVTYFGLKYDAYAAPDEDFHDPCLFPLHHTWN